MVCARAADDGDECARECAVMSRAASQCLPCQSLFAALALAVGGEVAESWTEQVWHFRCGLCLPAPRCRRPLDSHPADDPAHDSMAAVDG